MPIGGYVVVIENGSEVIEHELIADAGHPNVGERIVLDGTTYAVVAVQHEEDRDSHASARHTYARVFLRPIDPAPGVRAPRSDGDAPSAILPFVVPSDAACCALLPSSLVAVLVVAGYSEQKMVYRTGRRRVAQLLRAGDRWMALDGAEAWRLSRLAKRQLHAAIRFALALAGAPKATPDTTIDATLDDDRVATSPSVAPASSSPSPPPAPGPKSLPPARSGPPALRLVLGGQDRETGGEYETRET